MKEEDKIKKYLNQNLKNNFYQPRHEFSEILNKIEDQPKKNWNIPLWTTGIATVMILMVTVINWPEQKPELTAQEEEEILSVLVESQTYTQNTEITDYDSYLVLLAD